jgi:hypothetical protein
LTEPVRDLLRTLALPQTVVFAHRQRTGSIMEIRVFAVSPRLAVEQVPEMGSAYQLSVFRPEGLLERVVAFCELSDRPLADGRPCTIPYSAFLRVIDQAATDRTGTLARLRAEGVAKDMAVALVTAVSLCERLAQVTVMRRPSTTRLEGTTTAWLDGGAGGLWSVDAPKLARSGDYGDYGEGLLDRSEVTVAPTTAKTLLDEILSGFPDRNRA